MEKKFKSTKGVPAQISGLGKSRITNLKQETIINYYYTGIADLEARYKQNLKKMEN